MLQYVRKEKKDELEMIRFGILRREVFGDKPPIEVHYQLTPFGLRFMKIIEEVRRLQNALDRGEIHTEAGE